MAQTVPGWCGKSSQRGKTPHSFRQNLNPKSRHNRKEYGNYYRIMEKKMETTIVEIF